MENQKKIQDFPGGVETRRTKSCNFLTDSCQFLMTDTDDQSFNIQPKILPLCLTTSNVRVWQRTQAESIFFRLALEQDELIVTSFILIIFCNS